MKNQIHKQALLLLLSLLIISCGKEEQKLETKDKTQAIAVWVGQSNGNGNSPFLSVSGKIQSVNSADLSTRMMGYVTKVYVNIGDKVKKGQILVSLNNQDLQAQKAQVNAKIIEATAAYNNTKKDYDRYQNLFAQKSASQKELDDVYAQFEIAKARLEAARQMKNEVGAQFAYTNIAAPFNGIVTSKNIEVGDMANPGMTLLSMESPGEFEVQAMVPESEISEIKKGVYVDVLVKSINTSIKGKVKELSSSAKHSGGQYLVKIALDKTDAKILSGMFVSVQFPIEKKEKNEMVLVPKTAIVSSGQLSGIYTLSQSNTAILRWLTLGKSFGEQVEVLSGLSSDETYIVSAEGKLYNGAKIVIK